MGLPLCSTPEGTIASKVEEGCHDEAHNGARAVVVSCVVIDKAAENAKISTKVVCRPETLNFFLGVSKVILELI